MMEERIEVVYDPQNHPWLEMPMEDTVDEEIPYSLDELRVGSDHCDRCGGNCAA